jgi:hypothetical protein
VLQHQDNMIKLGKLMHKDYAGTVMGLKLFDKLTLETAIDSVIDDIVKDFNIGNMFEILDDFGYVKYNMRTNYFYMDNYIKAKEFSEKELCDNLWNAVISMFLEM